MAGNTSHYRLQKLAQSDSFDLNGYKFTNADRDQIDRLLYQGAEGHRHTGTSTSTATPSTGPSATVSTTGGTLSSGLTIYYKYALVDIYGNETAASPETVVSTIASLLQPSSPTMTTQTTGGTHLPGNYFYVLSAFTGANTSETKALSPAYITVPVGTSTNKVVLTLPTLPSGASGFNIYRKGPGDLSYFFLASLNIGATPATTYTDNNSVTEDCNRSLPTSNTTNNTNKVRISYPGTTPTIPAGYTWKIYRSFSNGIWDNTTLHWVVEETSVGSGIIVTYYDDVGNSTSGGRPQDATISVGQPTKILLTNSTEVQGSLPMGNVAGFPFEVTFAFSGTLSVQTGKSIWICEFPNFQVLTARAVLGLGSTPASASVIVDVNKISFGATPTAVTMFANQASRPRVLVGATRGATAAPDSRFLLVAGDGITCDVDQVGGGATPTDNNLTIHIYGFAYGFPTTSWVNS